MKNISKLINVYLYNFAKKIDLRNRLPLCTGWSDVLQYQ